jgi:Amidohydrolase family
MVTGIPLGTAECIQSSARIGRRWPGLVFVVHKIGGERDASVFRSFPKFVEQGDRFIEPVPITGRSRRVLERTVAGLELARIWIVHERDVLRYATINGAKALRLDGKTGSLTPGKEADIIILDATRINVAPLNQVPGAVVSLMDRTNVETVIVAGKVRKWKGQLLEVDLPHLRRQLEASRDYVFAAAGIEQDLFRRN